ncbi:MAG: hypothetical protein ACLT00_05975 [Collinsella sp.]
MLDTTTFVGLDVHARSIKAVSLDVMTGEVRVSANLKLTTFANASRRMR